MSWKECEGSLNKSVDDLALGYPIIAEGDTEDRLDIAGANDYWIELNHLPAKTNPLDKILSDQYNGIFQVSVYGKKNIGKGGYLDLADTIISNYKTGTNYSSGASIVEIAVATPSKLRPDGSFNVLDISIEWFSFTDRN